MCRRGMWNMSIISKLNDIEDANAGIIACCEEWEDFDGEFDTMDYEWVDQLFWSIKNHAEKIRKVL